MRNNSQNGARRSTKNRSAPSRAVVEIHSTAEFESIVLESKRPAIVDFWAPWCGPCKMTAPIFEAVAKEYGDRIVFAKVDTQAAPQVAQMFNIRSIPTIIVFYQGDVFDVRVGATMKPRLIGIVQRVLDKQEGIGMMGKIKRWFKKEAQTQPEFSPPEPE